MLLDLTLFLLLIPNLETTPGLPVPTDILYKDFSFQMAHGCTALNKQRAAGLQTSKT